MEKVTVIGAGLAGSEAAWQLAEMGVPVKLAEMRPAIGTPAHHTGYCAELVCSNSFRAAALTNAVGLLKEEMRRLGSVIMECADAHRVPAGGALAVDRNGYAAAVTKKIKSHPLIEFVNEEIREIPEEGIVIIATGPLTDGALADSIESFCGGEGLHFYDAAAPIVMKESLDMDIVYRMSRYNKGEAAYLNCPMNEEEYNAFYEALRTAETAEVHGFEEGNVFEGCMPVEVMAQRGKDTMRFGPMKPVGLPDPRTGKEPYAVVQLRQDNAVASLYNIVGFQTHLKWGEQKRLLSMIPGLENVSIVRYGVMHRNSYLCAPKVLRPTYQHVQRDDLFFAGQLCGVEGYVESAASGLLAGMNMANLMREKAVVELPDTCVIGSMAHYITHASERYFQPMNANFGIMRLLEKVKKKERKEAFANQALSVIDTYKKEFD